MNLTEAKDKYKDVVEGYSNPDYQLIVHEKDIDLQPIKFILPRPPDWIYIDNFGLRPKKQKFQRVIIPERLIDLNNSGMTVEEIWEEIDNNQRKYREEIKWVRLQWYRFINGYWVFINGKPTYITGWNYFYCNFWNIDIGLPEYRDRDRKFFLFAEFIKRDRKLMGFNYPKHRREGATSKAQCINYCIMLLLQNAKSGIQSMTESHAREVYLTHLIAPWKRLLFIWRPMHDGSTEPKGVLSLKRPADRSKKQGGKIITDFGLNSELSFKSSEIGAYDTYKLYFWHGDEAGKMKDIDVSDRWRKVKPCLSQANGALIHGFAIHTSTVEEMEEKGGKQFLKLCKDSDWYDRDNNGSTVTGLVNLFLPAYEGLDQYVGEFGESIISAPTKEQLKYLKSKFVEFDYNDKEGAKSYLENQQKLLIEKGDFDALHELKRQYPMRWRDCWINPSKNSDFPMEIIENRIGELQMSEPKTQRGDFIEVDGIDSDVVWKENENGRWLLSLRLDPSQTNKWYIKNGVKYPMYPDLFTAGADPFKFDMTEGKRLSNFGGSVFWERDKLLDDDNKDITQWESHRFVCTYRNRTSGLPEACEDMIKMCRYFGASMFPEINVYDIVRHFMERGYGGFLKYQWDYKTGKFKKNPGFNSVGAVKQELFNSMRDYLKLHGLRENHIEILQECQEIGGIDYMTDFDVFTASAGCLLGSKQPKMSVEPVKNNQKKYFNKRRY